MKKSSLLISGFIFSLLITASGCGEDSSSADDLAPQPPLVIARSDDGIYPQSGIRPEPTSSAENYWMRIEWERSPETDVKGYIIRRGSINPEEGTTYPVSQLEYGLDLSDNPTVTEHYWIDTGRDNFSSPSNLLRPILGEPQDYFWQIAAYDESENRSEWSDTVRYTLIENPFDFSVSQLGPGDYSLNWRYPTSTSLQYKVRIYSNYLGRDDVIWDPPLFHGYTEQQSIRLDSDGSANPLQQDCTYVWQLNAIRDHESGAAIFMTFTYQD
jgi:hypothetical protein